MRLRRHNDQPEPDFDWRKIVCADEEAAKAEAERQEATGDLRS